MHFLSCYISDILLCSAVSRFCTFLIPSPHVHYMYEKNEMIPVVPHITNLGMPYYIAELEAESLFYV